MLGRQRCLCTSTTVTTTRETTTTTTTTTTTHYLRSDVRQVGMLGVELQLLFQDVVDVHLVFQCLVKLGVQAVGHHRGGGQHGVLHPWCLRYQLVSHHLHIAVTKHDHIRKCTIKSRSESSCVLHRNLSSASDPDWSSDKTRQHWKI